MLPKFEVYIQQFYIFHNNLDYLVEYNKNIFSQNNHHAIYVF